MATLDELRKDIDRIDEVLVRLLNERARVACEVGRLKKVDGTAVYQPEREKQCSNTCAAWRARAPSAPMPSAASSSASSMRRGGSSAAWCTTKWTTREQ